MSKQDTRTGSRPDQAGVAGRTLIDGPAQLVAQVRLPEPVGLAFLSR
jgi:hypothetical protein